MKNLIFFGAVLILSIAVCASVRQSQSRQSELEETTINFQSGVINRQRDTLDNAMQTVRLLDKRCRWQAERIEELVNENAALRQSTTTP